MFKLEIKCESCDLRQVKRIILLLSYSKDKAE